MSGKYYGTKAYLEVYSELIQAARYRGTVTYQEIAKIMGLPLQGSHMARETGEMLGEISSAENAQGRPMLSAVAVSVKRVSSSGFYGLARDMGKLEDDSKEGELQFWEAEKAAVYKTWQRELHS